VCSRRGAIQIHVYLYLYLTYSRQSDLQEANSFVGNNKFFVFGARPFVNHNTCNRKQPNSIRTSHVLISFYLFITVPRTVSTEKSGNRQRYLYCTDVTANGLDCRLISCVPTELIAQHRHTETNKSLAVLRFVPIDY